MSIYHYRITVDGTVGPITTIYPGTTWATAAEVAEERGLHAVFERRLVTDADILELLENPPRVMRVGPGRIAMPWEVFAEVQE
jgi:hypothetical protein